MARQRKQNVTPRALMELKTPGDVQVAPDGRRVAFSVSEADWDDNRLVSHIHVAVADEDAPSRQVTRGRSGEGRPLWSPDGKWLAFLTVRDDPEDEDGYDDEDEEVKAQVWLLPMDGGGGEAEKLTDAPEGVGAYDWLPDSSGIVYLAQEPRRKPLQTLYDDRLDAKDDAVVEREEKFRHQIWEIDREHKKPRLIHPGDYGIGEVAVSPDGNWVAFTTNYTGEVNDYHRADVWLVERAGGATRQLTEGPGGKYHPQWRRDGSEILFLRSLDPSLSFSQENLFAVPAAGGETRNLTAGFDHDLTGWHGVWQDGQGTIYVSVALGTTTAVHRLADGRFEPLIENDEHIHDFHVGPGGGVAYVASSSDDPPEVYWLAPGDEDAHALTDLNDDWYDKHVLAPTDVVSWRSPDGWEIEGLLTYPIGYEEGKRYPLIVSLHGGPHGRAVQELTPFTSALAYAAAGYAVLLPNYRGSEGYGEAFGTANRNDLGGGDYRDVLAGVDEAVARGIADPERLAVSGSSYGGYLVNWIVGHTPRFKAAVSKFGIFSLMTDFSNSQAPRWELEYLNGPYWDHPEEYARLSPASYVKDIHTPVLIMHGEGDPNTFIANSQEMYTALHLLGRPVEYVHYPREGHGFYEPQHRLDEVRRCVAWFDKHLAPDAAARRYGVGEKIMRDDWELTVARAEVVTFAGREEKDRRYAEVTFVLRDVGETKRCLTVGPGDVSLAREGVGRAVRPAGLPLDVLGERVLAEGTGWRLPFAPGKEERGLAVPVAVAFRIGRAGGRYAVTVKDFPPVTFDIPAADGKDEDKK